MRTAVRAIIIKDNNLLVMKRNKFGNEFYALIGGGVDAGETPETALVRELHEEAGVVFNNPRLVITEHAGDMFGIQYIYLCDYVSGEPALDPESEEAKITALGQNIYTPMWLPISDLPTVNLLPIELKAALLTGLQQGFPEEPLTLTVSS